MISEKILKFSSNIFSKLLYINYFVLILLVSSFNSFANINSTQDFQSAKNILIEQIGQDEATKFIKENNINLLLSNSNNQDAISIIQGKINNTQLLIQNLEQEEQASQSPSRRKEIREKINIFENAKIICLTNYFGKESAILSGIDNSKGDSCIIMDPDLEDPPSLINDMINESTDYQRRH